MDPKQFIRISSSKSSGDCGFGCLSFSWDIQKKLNESEPFSWDIQKKLNQSVQFSWNIRKNNTEVSILAETFEKAKWKWAF